MYRISTYGELFDEIRQRELVRVNQHDEDYIMKTASGLVHRNFLSQSYFISSDPGLSYLT